MKALKTILLCMVLATSAMAITGCRTAEGFGEDMENAGEKIQDESK